MNKELTPEQEEAIEIEIDDYIESQYHTHRGK